MTRPESQEENRKLGLSPSDSREGPLGRRRAETGEAGVQSRVSGAGSRWSTHCLSLRTVTMLPPGTACPPRAEDGPPGALPSPPPLGAPSPCHQPARACHRAPDGRQLVSVHVASPQALVKASPRESPKHPSKVGSVRQMSPEAAGTGEEIAAGESKEIGSVMLKSISQGLPGRLPVGVPHPGPVAVTCIHPTRHLPRHRLLAPIARCPPSSLALPFGSLRCPGGA